jgi:hypothetical protein
MSVVEIYREDGGRWRWAYRESAGTRAVPSNEDYPGVAEARSAAAAAYPGVAIAEREDGGQPAGPPGPPPSKGWAGKVAGWLTPVVVLVAWSRSRRYR